MKEDGGSMCQTDSNAQNAGISRGVIKILASSAGVILSRNITPKQRAKAEVKLLQAKQKINTMWCEKHGFPMKGEGGCVECRRELNARMAKENEARNANSK